MTKLLDMTQQLNTFSHLTWYFDYKWPLWELLTNSEDKSHDKVVIRGLITPQGLHLEGPIYPISFLREWTRSISEKNRLNSLTYSMNIPNKMIENFLVALCL